MKTFIEDPTTRDPRLFSAVAAMGISWSQESVSVEGGKRVWVFGDVSDCGKWKTGDLLSWWRDADLHKKDPKHPFHVVKTTMASDKGLREALRSRGGFRQEKRGDSLLILACQSDEPRTSTSNAIDDVSFVSAASGVGFRVTGAPSQGSRRIFSLSARSETYPYSFEDIRRWWLDRSFENANPQHPFAYAKAVAVTYVAAIDAIRADRPLVKWRPKGGHGTAYIHPDCSAETEAEVRSWFK